MENAPELEVLRGRLKSLLLFLKARTIVEGTDLNRLMQLSRMTDIRIRRFYVSKPRATVADLCGLLQHPAMERFDRMTEKAEVLIAPQMNTPLPPLGEEMGYLVEICLLLQVMGEDRMRADLADFTALEGPASPAPAPEAPAGGEPAETPIPEAVQKVLGNVKDLWSIPTHTKKILSLLLASESPIDEISAGIEKDPGLSAQCLRIVNSAYYGVISKVASVKRAIVILGYQATRQIVSLSSLLSRLNQKQSDLDFDLNGFWGHSLWVAHAASLTAKATHVGQPDDHFTAGLIHDIGKLVEYQYLPGQLRLIQKAVMKGTRYDLAEHNILGVGHSLIGATVCERWGFPPALVEAVRHHLDPIELLEELPLSREALVTAAMCALAKNTDDAESWGAFLRIPADYFEEIFRHATKFSLGSLKDVFVYG